MASVESRRVARPSACHRRRQDELRTDLPADCLLAAPGPGPNTTGGGSYCETELAPEVVTHAKHHVVQKKLYARGCRRYGVAPSTFYLRHTEDRQLTMKNHGLGANGVKALAIPLQVNAHVQTLDLQGNSMGAEGVRHLAFMLLENPNITSLNISNNQLGSAGARIICDALRRCKNIRQLDLSGNEFSDRDATHVGALLEEKDIFLRNINLSNNKFSEAGAVILANAIATNTTIDKLNLSWNHIRHTGAEAIAKCLQDNNNVDDLNLSMNGISQAGAELLGAALETNTCLRTLDVSNNRIELIGCSAIAQGLSQNETLTTLKIGMNPLTVGGTFALIQAISKNEKSSMERLDLTDTPVSRGFLETAQAIADERPFTHVVGGVTNWPSQVSEEEEDDDDPTDVLTEYLTQHDLRLADVFPCLGDDAHTGRVSRDEFVAALLGKSILLSEDQIEAIVSCLDVEDNDQLDLTLLLECC